MNTLTTAVAPQIINAALTEAHSRSYRPMGVVGIDAAGHLKASARDDGATPLRLDIARGKACAAAGMGSSSRVLTERAKQFPAFFGTIAATASQPFIAQTGAVLIKTADGEILGALGASGGTGDEDENICSHGVQTADLLAE